MTDRRPLVALAGTAVLVVVAALALAPRGVPAAPEPTVTSAIASPTLTAAQTAVPVQATPIKLRAWFARDQLPPVAADITAAGGPSDTPDHRILVRVGATRDARPEQVPGGATNPLAQVGTFQGSGSSFEVGAKLDGDLAIVELGKGQFERIRGAAMTEAVVAQLVYAATEEPGVRRVLLTERGGGRLTIDQLVLDGPLAREDVVGYSFKGSETSRIDHPGSDALQMTNWLVSNGIATDGQIGILGRLSLEVRAFSPPFEGAGTPPPAPRPDPAFKAELAPLNEGPSKWRITLTVPNAFLPSRQPTYLDFIGGPIEKVEAEDVARTCPAIGSCPNDTVIRIDLSDARPWRVTVGPGDPGVTRINVDVGGRPTFVNKNIAVYQPPPGIEASRIVIQGAARVFEANVVWRIRDASGRVVAQDQTTASIGTSPVWGTFETTATVPAGVTGKVTLEVLWISPKDGSDQDLVAIPLTVR